ncbi:MAG: Gfo/Idh/MocA family oxidoreductase [Acidobacteria bacterium]|nr:Gfo/Idh/MocA family oxidoreductase [Acidobacteriota bacterium]
MKRINPVIVGRGMAGQAIRKSLALASQTDRELNLLPIRQAERSSPLAASVMEGSESVLFAANPSGMHAASILEGLDAGFRAIAVEKPVCVRPGEIESLKGIDAFVSVYHVYRVLWGTRTIKAMVDAGELGEVFSFESRCWQSSSAHKALQGAHETTWKDAPELNGPYDALTDLGSHVADICLHLMADIPVRTRCRLSYRNAAAAHRDTHVHLWMDFPGGRHAAASISKTMHGASNDFEYTVVGTKGAATWKFLRPDEVVFGRGNSRKIIPREAPDDSSGSAPFHGLGWLQGYVFITLQTLRRASGLESAPVPVLPEALAAMEALLRAEIK